MAWVGHFSAAAMTLSAGTPAGSTTTATLSSSRSNAPGASYTQFPEPMHTFAVDFDFEAHGAIVGFDARRG